MVVVVVVGHGGDYWSLEVVVLTVFLEKQLLWEEEETAYVI